LEIFLWWVGSIGGLMDRNLLIDYDVDDDILYVRLDTRERGIRIPVESGTQVVMSGNNEVIGIEIYDATVVLQVDPTCFTDHKFLNDLLDTYHPRALAIAKGL
jgi:uncharacterized protein YuzE